MPVSGVFLFGAVKKLPCDFYIFLEAILVTDRIKPFPAVGGRHTVIHGIGIGIEQMIIFTECIHGTVG